MNHVQAQLPEHECSLLLEEYKLYVEMQDKISSRRDDANKFYVTLLTALLTILTLVVGERGGAAFQGVQPVAILSVGFLGMAVCVLWFATVRSYRQLNKAKFRVINEMEEALPYACYKREWELMRGRKKERKYVTPARLESAVPILFAIPYLLLFLISLNVLL